MIGFWVAIGIVGVLVLLGGGAFTYCKFVDGNKFISIIIGIGTVIVIAGLILFGQWYINSTASGLRMQKTYQSELQNGVERTVSVYDVNGELIKQYSGKFDVSYDDSRIIFDDENGKRHVIYYPTGTIIIDEK